MFSGWEIPEMSLLFIYVVFSFSSLEIGVIANVNIQKVKSWWLADGDEQCIQLISFPWRCSGPAQQLSATARAWWGMWGTENGGSWSRTQRSPAWGPSQPPKPGNSELVPFPR